MLHKIYALMLIYLQGIHAECKDYDIPTSLDSGQCSGSHILCHPASIGRKEGNVLFNNTLNTFYLRSDI